MKSVDVVVELGRNAIDMRQIRIAGAGVIVVFVGRIASELMSVQVIMVFDVQSAVMPPIAKTLFNGARP